MPGRQRQLLATPSRKKKRRTCIECSGFWQATLKDWFLSHLLWGNLGNSYSNTRFWVNAKKDEHHSLLHAGRLQCCRKTSGRLRDYRLLRRNGKVCITCKFRTQAERRCILRIGLRGSQNFFQAGW
ncbi:hypothetical protein HJG60_012277 [Phyllostomus discolor]|uniref:Uncharacterized protein n=1 Tax=Phyllostomus discolor TaxID=89673 RepID=A0A833ZDQ9_9CHIR|nr:hypothetical protein HJG60_012277 [Phyllostomus discolor]